MVLSNRSLASLAALSVASALVFGLTYSSAKAPAVESQPSAVAALSGEQICSRDLKQHVQFNDPDSVRINSVTPNDLRPGRYWMSVSAKNAYGGYGDPLSCSCGVDTTSAKALDIHCAR